ncbi:hypothetical protein POL58_24350 [Nannocystis sp. ncelm1]|uniref:Uncharacterized protein n=1 Tax=Nannocystis radixulma TaxID=2995305 RepID=A0ABT5BCX2_9BACT|nr:hypothetical protein [Nannocystis radixulma]
MSVVASVSTIIVVAVSVDGPVSVALLVGLVEVSVAAVVLCVPVIVLPPSVGTTSVEVPAVSLVCEVGDVVSDVDGMVAVAPAPLSPQLSDSATHTPEIRSESETDTPTQ